MKLSDLRRILTAYDIRPDKSKGQHFLLDESVVADMLTAAAVSKEDTVIEIGPGLGVLTSALAQRAGQVLAYELDPALATLVESQQVENVEVIRGDIMDQSLPRRGTSLPYKIVANIPYSISGALVRKALTSLPAPVSVTFLIQREVAERMCAAPGQMSVLAVATQLHGRPSIVRMVPAASFWPVPKVESAVVHVEVVDGLTLDVDEPAFMRLVKFGFAQKRKQLKNTLAAGFRVEPSVIEQQLVQAGLKPTARAQELSLEQWRDLLLIMPSS